MTRLRTAPLTAVFVAGAAAMTAGCVVWAAVDTAKHGIVRGHRGRH